MSDEDWALEVEAQEAALLSSKVKDMVINHNVAKEKIISPSIQAPPKDEKPKQEKETDASLASQSLLAKFLRNKLVESTKEVEVQKKDPNSPLYSVKSFEELPLKENLRKGIYNMGFNSPSKIQETALPMLLADPPNNMIAQSQSGTGKTAAFSLTMLSRVDPSKGYPQVLCLAPTYELALQIGDVVKRMAQFCPEIEVAFAVRGNRVTRGHKINSHIVIGTPGTVLDWILRFRVFDPKKIKVFVLDEADVMIDTQGHQDQSIRIHKTLSGKDCQMLLFSATYTDKVLKFASVIVPDPVTIRLRREEESLDNIRQFYALCKSQEDKYVALSNMYGMVSIGQCIVFCHTRKSAAWLAQKMTGDGHSVALLSGDISVEQRLAVITRFREAKEKLLITTNVCARGIDIEQVTVVINYDLPELEGKPDFETYLHRIGRTGRFGKTGLAINYIDGDRSMSMLKEIEKHFGKKIEKLDYTDMDELEKLN